MADQNKITFIGVGRLGLCIALTLEHSGYSILGIDTNEEYVKSLNSKTFTTYEPYVEKLLKGADKFRASTNLKEGLDHSDIIFIMVPTPNGGGNNYYDHIILSNLLLKINSLCPSNKTFVIGCTVIPGYNDKIGKSLISDCVNCTLNYHPEFVAQGSIINNYTNPDIILIGESDVRSGDLIEKICLSVVENKPKVCRMPVLEAELTKISLNGFITTKIAYANMIGDLCNNMNANKDLVLAAVGSDSRVGQKCLKAGYSYSGPCFPRDTKMLSYVLRSNNVGSDIPDAVHISNESHVDNQVCEIFKSIKGNSVTISDVCYKENCHIPIIEHSAKLKIAYKLAKLGIKVTIVDRQHMINEVRKEYGNIFNYQVVDL